ncbi:hypothetical protein V1477_019844 [Vespula maculifrons]|uniref:Uncharacterized protein n=1 Tax=Vespula maculifrons TaxID=7453 RepID=A0ABD2AK78_VESMC
MGGWLARFWLAMAGSHSLPSAAPTGAQMGGWGDAASREAEATLLEAVSVYKKRKKQREEEPKRAEAVSAVSLILSNATESRAGVLDEER